MNKNQLAALLRAALLSAGAALVEHNVITGPALQSLVNWLVAGAMIIVPIVWSLWSKTHAQQAAAAVKLVNSVEAIVVNPESSTAYIAPGMSLKPMKPDVPVASGGQTALLFLTVILSLGLAGCVSGPQAAADPSTWAKVAGGTAQDIAAGGIPLVLDRNPSWAPAIALVGQAIPTAFGDSALTPDGITATTTSLGNKYGLGVAFQQLLARAVNRAVVDYGLLSGHPVTTADPNLRIILEDIGAGLTQGVDDWQKRQQGGFWVDLVHGLAWMP